MLPDLHIGFSRGRSGGLVFPSLSEFSTVYSDPLYRRQGSRPSSWKRKAKKAKWLSGEALQTAEKRREAKSKGEKERYKHLNAEYQRKARRDKKDFFSS